MHVTKMNRTGGLGDRNFQVQIEGYSKVEECLYRRREAGVPMVRRRVCGVGGGEKDVGKTKVFKANVRANSGGGKPIVSVSDEAFALLMLDNYYVQLINVIMVRF